MTDSYDKGLVKAAIDWSIRECRTEHGIYWCSPVGPDEPAETHQMCKRVAATIAEGEAIDTGKNHVVAETQNPLMLHVFAVDHPEFPRADMGPARDARQSALQQTRSLPSAQELKSPKDYARAYL